MAWPRFEPHLLHSGLMLFLQDLPCGHESVIGDIVKKWSNTFRTVDKTFSF